MLDEVSRLVAAEQRTLGGHGVNVGLQQGSVGSAAKYRAAIRSNWSLAAERRHGAASPQCSPNRSCTTASTSMFAAATASPERTR